MIKGFVVITLVLAVAPSGVSRRATAVRPTDKDKEGLIGPIKTVRSETFTLIRKDGDSVEGNREELSESTYDISGNLVELDQWGPALVACGPHPYPQEWTVRRWNLFAYDSTGTLVERTSYASYPADSETYLIERSISRMLPDSQAIALDTYDDKGQLNSTFLSHLDRAGREIKTTYLRPNGEAVSTHVWTYDANGFISSDSGYEADGSPSLRWEYARNEKGNLTEEQLFHRDGSLFCRVHYAYDFKFDSFGNWVKRIKTSWNDYSAESKARLSEVTYRTLEYYQGSTYDRDRHLGWHTFSRT